MDRYEGVRIIPQSPDALPGACLCKPKDHSMVVIKNENLIALDLKEFHNQRFEEEISKLYPTFKFMMYRPIQHLYILDDKDHNTLATEFLDTIFKGDLYCFLKIDGKFVDFTVPMFDVCNRDLARYRKQNSINSKSSPKEIITRENTDCTTSLAYMLEYARYSSPDISKHLENFSAKDYAKIFIEDNLLKYIKFHSGRKESEINTHILNRHLAILAGSKDILAFLNKDSLRVINKNTYMTTVKKIIIDYLKEFFGDNTSIPDDPITDADYVNKYLYELSLGENRTSSSLEFFMLIGFMRVLNEHEMLTVTDRMKEINHKYNNRLLVEVLGCDN